MSLLNKKTGTRSNTLHTTLPDHLDVGEKADKPNKHGGKNRLASNNAHSSLPDRPEVSEIGDHQRDWGSKSVRVPQEKAGAGHSHLKVGHFNEHGTVSKA
jgi:hypothetical protein